MQIEEQKGDDRREPRVPAHPGRSRPACTKATASSSGHRAPRAAGRSQQVSDALIGTPGTKVKVKFARPGVAQPIELAASRAPSSTSRPCRTRIMLDGKIGYVPLQQFNENRGRGNRDARSTPARSRARSGSSSTCAATRAASSIRRSTISNLFLKQRPGDRQRARAPGDRRRSSRAHDRAAHHHAAARRSHRRLHGVRVRDRRRRAAGSRSRADRRQTSFGKGLVQTVFPLDGGWALKITTAKWYTPSGRSIQKERKLLPNGDFVERSPTRSRRTA